MHHFAVISPQHANIDLTQSQGLVEHRVEHRREVARRGVDDLQYLGSCGLLLKGLTRLGQEPRILHRDHCLRGEVLQQRHLLVRKRPHLQAGRGDQAQECVLFAQWYKQDSADARELRSAPKYRMVDLRAVCNLDKAFTVNQCPARR